MGYEIYQGCCRVIPLPKNRNYEKVEMQETINSQDIRKGDLLKITRPIGDVRLTIEGVAHHQDRLDRWITKGSKILSTLRSNETITLIKRQEIVDGVYWVTPQRGEKTFYCWKVTVEDGEAQWVTSDGVRSADTYEWLVKIKNGEVSGRHFHREDPTPWGFDALDKTKRYFVESNHGGISWHLVFKDDGWKYGLLGDIMTNAKSVEADFTGGSGPYKLPVIDEPTLQEQLDDLGVDPMDIYSTKLGAFAQFIGGGKVRFMSCGKRTWEKIDLSELFLYELRIKKLTKI